MELSATEHSSAPAAESARGIPVLHVSGEVDLATADGVRIEAEDALRRCTDLMIIDLSAVAFLDSSGLRVLDDIQQRAGEVGVTIAIVCPEPRLLKLLEITGLDQHFAIHATTEGAAHAASNDA